MQQSGESFFITETIDNINDMRRNKLTIKFVFNVLNNILYIEPSPTTGTQGKYLNRPESSKLLLR